jgi:hypothetical protein
MKYKCPNSADAVSVGTLWNTAWLRNILLLISSFLYYLRGKWKLHIYAFINLPNICNIYVYTFYYIHILENTKEGIQTCILFTVTIQFQLEIWNASSTFSGTQGLTFLAQSKRRIIIDSTIEVVQGVKLYFCCYFFEGWTNSVCETTRFFKTLNPVSVVLQTLLIMWP